LPRLLFFGDSLTAGKWAPSGGWAACLCAMAMQASMAPDRQAEWLPYNLGIHGNTTRDVTARLEAEVMARVPPDELASPQLQIVLAVGVKDTLSNDPLRFENDLRTLVLKAKALARRIVLVELAPVNEVRLAELGGRPYSNAVISSYNKILRNAAGVEAIAFAPVYDALLMQPTYLADLVDGLHPGVHGHGLLADLVKPHVFID
jgi:lysophospholipase L1-like esterase